MAGEPLVAPLGGFNIDWVGEDGEVWLIGLRSWFGDAWNVVGGEYAVQTTAWATLPPPPAYVLYTPPPPPATWTWVTQDQAVYYTEGTITVTGGNDANNT